MTCLLVLRQLLLLHLFTVVELYRTLYSFCFVVFSVKHLPFLFPFCTSVVQKTVPRFDSLFVHQPLQRYACLTDLLKATRGTYQTTADQVDFEGKESHSLQLLARIRKLELHRRKLSVKFNAWESPRRLRQWREFL